MNKKAKGIRRERQTVKLLQERGLTAVRTAASRGPFDVIALVPDGERARSRVPWRVYCIQVKCNAWPSGDEMAELELWAAKHSRRFFKVEVWRWDDGDSAPRSRSVL